MIRCYHDIKQLAAEIDCPVGDLIAMTGSSDPFYAGVPSRREKALWFAELWERFGFSGGFHRRGRHHAGQNPAIRSRMRRSLIQTGVLRFAIVNPMPKRGNIALTTGRNRPHASRG